MYRVQVNVVVECKATGQFEDSIESGPLSYDIATLDDAERAVNEWAKLLAKRLVDEIRDEYHSGNNDGDDGEA